MSGKMFSQAVMGRATDRRMIFNVSFAIVGILTTLWFFSLLRNNSLSDVQDYVESKLPGSGPVEYTVNIRVNDIKPSSKTEDASLPRTFLWDIDDLVSLRDRYREGKSTEDFNKTLAWLRRDLKPSLDRDMTFTVTSAIAAPLSGDKHDYQSMGYYWWPCNEAIKVCNKEVPEMYGLKCDEKTGLPWVVCDGADNEKTKEYSSKEPMQRMTFQVTELALLWWFTGDDHYAEVATKLLRIFYLDAATKMNPNLNFAQWVPGLETFDSVNGFGIIEIKDWSELLDAVAILRTSKAWSKKEDEALTQWFSELLVWLLESERGNLERHRDNNHGVWFHQTALAIALHVGDAHSAKMLANDLPWFLVDRQIEQDGKLPEEVARPRPIHYVCYALTAFLRTARLASFVGVDVWSHLAMTEDSENRQNYLKNAVRWIMPYFTRAEDFPYEDVDRGGRKGEIWHRCIEPVAIAMKGWGNDPEFKQMCKKGLQVQADQYWIEPRVYGQPVYLVFDLDA